MFGGLGNQFFQYYAGIHLAEALNCKLSFDMRWIEAGFGHPQSDMRDFNIDGNIRWITAKSDGPVNFPRERIKTVLGRQFPFLGKSMKLSVLSDFEYLIPELHSEVIEVRGYFQNSTYFSRIHPSPDPLVLKFESRDFLSCRDYLLEEQFVGIHVRGGDYLSKNRIYRNLSTDYYMKAIERSLADTGLNKIVVFYDDREYAKQTLGSRFKFEFLPAFSMPASDELALLSLGSSVIIANSTFSYWAAVRSGSRNVIAPENWMLNKVLPKEFYPFGWTILPTP
jgi:hypothetical protein